MKSILNVQNLLILIFTLLVFSSMLTLSLLLINTFSTGLKKQTIESIETDTADTLLDISKLIESVISDMQFLTSIESDHTHSLDDIIEERFKLAQKMEESTKSYEYFSVHDLNGKEIKNTSNIISNSNVSMESFFISALAGNVYYDQFPTYSEQLKKPVLYISGPILSNGEISAVLSSTVSLNKINGILRENDDRLSGDYYLLSSNGDVIFSNRKHDPSVFEFLQMMYDKHVGSKIYSEINQNTNQFIVFTEQSTYRNYHGSGWSLIVIYDLTKLDAYTKSVELNMSILVFIFVSIAVIASILVSLLFSRAFSVLYNYVKYMYVDDITLPKSRLKEFNDLFLLINEARVQIRHKNELEMQIAKDAQERIKSEKLSAIGQVTARIAHDIRNPISVITTTLEVMRNSMEQNNKNTENFDRLDRAASRINHQINDVLEFVRITPLNYSSINVNEFITSVVDKIKVPENIKIRTTGQDTLQIDPVKIETVFVNLFLNSIEAIGKKSGEITVSIKNEQVKTIISLSDTAQNLSEENRLKLFEPLFTTKQKGTGLGLVSCKNIIEQHGGTITVKTNPTTFTITLPKNTS